MKRKSLKTAQPEDSDLDNEASDTSAASAAEAMDQQDSEPESAAMDGAEKGDAEESAADGGEKRERKRKHGIIYLSTIPKHMTVSIAREMFSQYAAVGRMFFQPSTTQDEQNKSASKKKKSRFQPRHFAEGWVEFESKRAAKAVALRLNGQPIALRKSSKFADILWSLKYLPRFKWVHLSERLTYEKAVHKQRLNAEVSQARREAQFFQENLDRSDKNKRLSKKKARVTALAAAAAKA